MSHPLKKVIEELNNIPIKLKDNYEKTYREQCRYIANKLFFVNREDVEHIIFFIKLQTIFDDLPHILFIFKNGLNLKKENYKYSFDEGLQTHNINYDDYFYVGAETSIYILNIQIIQGINLLYPLGMIKS